MKIVQLADISDSVKMQRLRVGWMRRVGAGILCKSFCGGERENERRNEREQIERA